MENEEKYKEALEHLSVLKNRHNMLWNRQPDWWLGMKLLEELKSDCHEEGKKAFDNFHNEISDFFIRRGWYLESSMKPVECVHCKSVKYFMVRSSVTEAQYEEALKRIEGNKNGQ